MEIHIAKCDKLVAMIEWVARKMHAKTHSTPRYLCQNVLLGVSYSVSSF